MSHNWFSKLYFWKVPMASLLPFGKSSLHTDWTIDFPLVLSVLLSLGPSLPMSNSAHQMCGQLVSILCRLLANFDQFGLPSCQDSPQETAANYLSKMLKFGKLAEPSICSVLLRGTSSIACLKLKNSYWPSTQASSWCLGQCPNNLLLMFWDGS
jgi:hypothetical protein